jgi:hypothetical protein
VLSERAYAELDRAYDVAQRQIAGELRGLEGEGAAGRPDLPTLRQRLLHIENAALNELRRQGQVDPATDQELAQSLEERSRIQPPDQDIV